MQWKNTAYIDFVDRKFFSVTSKNSDNKFQGHVTRLALVAPYLASSLFNVSSYVTSVE